MRFPWLASCFAVSAAMVVAACSSAPAVTGGSGGSGTGQNSGTGTGTGTGGSTGTATATATVGSTTTSTGTGTGGGTTTGTGGSDAGAPADKLDPNRDRLLGTYFDYLKANAVQPQSNGLSGSNVSSVCDVWNKLDPSSQAVFLTLTARLQGSVLGDDGSSMLAHITKVYRITGGQGATASAPGSCGGGEYNRMIMSMDAHLQKSQLATNTHKGALQGNGKYDIADIPASSYWRDSHDLGGPHAPFNLSDETNQGAPRGQTQFFTDPTAAVANAPLGRMDLATLVDPYAVEMDQDYDCVHNSNPTCSYVTYGPFCLPEASMLGTDLFTMAYGSFEPGWKPSGC